MANPILNTGTFVSVNSSSITLTFPTTYSGGTAIALIMGHGTSGGTPPGSWTAIGGGQTVVSSGSSRLTHLQLSTDGTEGGTTQAFTFGASERRVGVIIATDGSLGQVSTGGFSTSATSINHDTVTTANNDSAILYILTGLESSPILTDYTVAQTELGEAATAQGSNDVVLAVGYENFPTAGTTTTRTSTGPADAASTLGQKTLSVYVTGGGSAPTISGTSNPKAGETVTITVDSYDTVSGVTYGGISLTSVTEATATTITATMPTGGLALGSSNDFVVTDANGSSAGFADVYEARTGYSYVTTTADASAFNTASPWYNLAGMVTGDQIEYELALDPTSGTTVTAVDAATGLPTLSSNITVDNVSSYYIWDASDTYSVGTVGTINWNETVVPTFSSAAVPSAGTTLVVTFSENMDVGADGGNGMTVTASGGAVTLSYASTSTNTITYNTSRTIGTGETLSNLSYTQPGDGLTDASNLSNALASFSGQAVTNNSTADITSPQFSSASIATSGTTVSIVFDEPVDFGAGGNTGFALTGLESAVTLSYSSGSGSDTLVYSTSRTIGSHEGNGSLAYTQPGNGVEDGSGNDLGSFSGQTVTNNSTQDIVAPVFQSAAIAADGDSISITYGEAVTVGAGGNTGYTISASGGASTLTYSSGDGTTTLVYTLSRTIEYGETITLSYTNPGNGVEDAAGNDAANLSAESVTNSSIINAPTATQTTGIRISLGIAI